MEEIEAICQRVAIIDYGKILVQGTLDELVDKSHADLYVRVAGPQTAVKQQLAGLADVSATNGHGTQAILSREQKTAPRRIPGRPAQRLEALAKGLLGRVAVGTH